MLHYLSGSSWAAISREERLYCAELYFKARERPIDLVELINREAHLDLDPTVHWELAYEVCFYRDVLHHGGKPKKGSGYSLKRTFDLALFSPTTVVIIEAKVCERFKAKESATFRSDTEKLPGLLGPGVEVVLVALASKRYFAAFDKRGDKAALEPFANRRLSWEAVSEKYGGDILNRAACLYGAKGIEPSDAEARGDRSTLVRASALTQADPPVPIPFAPSAPPPV